MIVALKQAPQSPKLISRLRDTIYVILGIFQAKAEAECKPERNRGVLIK